MTKAAAALAVVVLAGCQAPARDTTAPAVADGQLSAVAVYGRHAAVRGKVDVRITNRGPGTVRIESYQVRHPMFDVVAPAARSSTLPDDRDERIVPVPFGAPRCEVTDPSGALVVLGVRTAAGMRDVEIPLPDGEPGLVRAHRLACDAAAVTESVTFDLGPAFVRETGPAGPVLRTALHLRRRGTQPVTVTQLTGNILFTVRTPPSVPLVSLEAGQPETQVEVQVSASRCEAHALTESKRSFSFPLFASVGDGEPTQVQVTVSDPARAALQSLLDDTCGPLLGLPGG